MRIFAPAGPCATGPAEMICGRLFSSTGPSIDEHMPKQPLIGRYARIIMDDWFKRSFGKKGSERLLQLFLQELIPEHHIAHLTYTNTEHINPHHGKKDVRIDVECIDEDGTRFTVEVQVAPQRYFYERALFNSTFAIQQQKDRGEGEYDFPTVYFVGIMDFSLHKGSDQVDFRYVLREINSGELMTKRIQYIFLELPNSLGKALTPNATVLQNICYALHMMEHLTERPAELKEEIFNLLFETAEIANFTPEDRTRYEQIMTTARDIRNQIAYAREEGILLLAEQMRKLGIPEEQIEKAISEAKKQQH